MSLLRDIQEEAMAGKGDLPTLLRKCLVLAARLKSDELRAWVKSELDGYEADVGLPAYRIRRTHIRGTLRRYLGMSIETRDNAPIPAYALDREIFAQLSKIDFRQGAASLERMVSTEEISLRMGLPAEVAMLISHGLDGHTECADAYKVLAVQDVVEILDTVRTRVLDFTLELEKLHPEAAEEDKALASVVSAAATHQLFVTVIQGGQIEDMTVGSKSEQHVIGSTVGAVAQGPSSKATGSGGDGSMTP